MNAMVPGLAGGKMSASDPNSKIDFLEAPEVVRKKIKAAFCEEGNVAENGILAFIQAVLIPISQLRLENIKKGGSILEKDSDLKPFASDDAPEGTVFSIERDAKFGGSTHYASYEDLKNDFAEKKVHPKDLKAAVVDALNRLLDPIRKAFAEDEEAQRIEKLAYPDPNAKEKKQKKVRHCWSFILPAILKSISSPRCILLRPTPRPVRYLTLPRTMLSQRTLDSRHSNSGGLA
jgi:tyrosyl-tRNA synthetase